MQKQHFFTFLIRSVLAELAVYHALRASSTRKEIAQTLKWSWTEWATQPNSQHWVNNSHACKTRNKAISGRDKRGLPSPQARDKGRGNELGGTRERNSPWKISFFKIILLSLCLCWISSSLLSLYQTSTWPIPQRLSSKAAAYIFVLLILSRIMSCSLPALVFHY